MKEDNSIDNLKLRAKKEQELMKHRLSFLPEFKQEIQSLLELPHYKRFREAPPPHTHFHEQYVPLLELTENKNIFFRLQDCLSRLEKIPDVQEETDRMKVVGIFGEFEKIKLKARLLILMIRTNLALGIENWVNHSSAYTWAVNIFPVFYIPARIVATLGESGYRLAFGVCLSEETASTSILTMDLPSSWIDLLQAPLQQVNLFQNTQQLSLDGIEYELSTCSGTSQGVLWFGNPSTPPLIEVEKAFFRVAEMIVKKNGDLAEEKYLAEWKRYLAK